MILAGIDEAGYGPLLGPLVVGCCAFQLDGVDPNADLPCLWKRLRRIVGKTRSRSGKKIHVNDSKQVYSPSLGIKELERSILALSAAWQEMDENLMDLLGRVAPHAMADLKSYAWYGPTDDEAFPISQPAVGVKMFANALRQEMLRTETKCVHLGARVVAERQLNQQFDATRNKSSVLFSTSAVHLDHLLRNFANKGLVIFCDQQGGRHRYGPLLRLMFDDWSLEVVSEGDGRSEYRMMRKADAVRIIFCEKAEAQCMSVAVASMLSKYLREALMRRFNAFWKQHLPQLEPTAGYHGDGDRFLNDINPKRLELGISDFDLIRSR